MIKDIIVITSIVLLGLMIVIPIVLEVFHRGKKEEIEDPALSIPDVKPRKDCPHYQKFNKKTEYKYVRNNNRGV